MAPGDLRFNRISATFAVWNRPPDEAARGKNLVTGNVSPNEQCLVVAVIEGGRFAFILTRNALGWVNSGYLT